MSTFRRLLGFLAPYRGEVIITAVLAAGTQAAGLLIPYLTGKVIDAAQAGDPRSQIYTYSLLIIASGVVKGVMMLFRRWLAGRLSLAVEYDLRNRMYGHMQRLSYASSTGTRRGSCCRAPPSTCRPCGCSSAMA